MIMSYNWALQIENTHYIVYFTQDSGKSIIMF